MPTLIFSKSLRLSSANVTKSTVSIWSHLLKKSLMVNFVFCAVFAKIKYSVVTFKASVFFRKCIFDHLTEKVDYMLVIRLYAVFDQGIKIICSICTDMNIKSFIHKAVNITFKS